MAKVETALLSPSDEKLEEAQAAVKEYDFIRFTIVDMNGVLRGQLYPADYAANFLKSGVKWFAGLMGLGTTTGVFPKEVMDCNYGNAHVYPDINTLHPVPWVDKYRVGQFMTEMYWNPTTPQEACTRNIARRMLNKLDNMGLKLFSGVELEFVLTNQETQLPVFSTPYACSMMSQAEYESWFYDVASNMKKAGVCTQNMHVEINPGLFEFTTEPKYGVEAADSTVILKQGIKEMARRKGWYANFMAVPFDDNLVSCGHFNFSVWHKVSGKNALWDEMTEDNISEFGKHWIAGMIHHTKALTALSRITPNCYRVKQGLVPDKANWGIDDRTAMLRVKNDSPEATLIENRVISSSFNPYLVMAATIAAGLDGVVRKLTCPDPHDVSEALKLPNSLKEALDYLQEDTVMVEALGATFVEWFVQCKKEADLQIFEGVADDGELLELERKHYAYLM